MTLEFSPGVRVAELPPPIFTINTGTNPQYPTTFPRNLGCWCMSFILCNLHTPWSWKGYYYFPMVLVFTGLPTLEWLNRTVHWKNIWETVFSFDFISSLSVCILTYYNINIHGIPYCLHNWQTNAHTVIRTQNTVESRSGPRDLGISLDQLSLCGVLLLTSTCQFWFSVLHSRCSQKPGCCLALPEGKLDELKECIAPKRNPQTMLIPYSGYFSGWQHN